MEITPFIEGWYQIRFDGSEAYFRTHTECLLWYYQRKEICNVERACQKNFTYASVPFPFVLKKESTCL